MKKYIQILLVTFLTLSMAACGNTEVDETVVMQDDVVIENDDTEEIIEETVNTEEESTGYYPGTFTETGYETEFLGFRFTTPEGYSIATPEYYAELMGTTMDELTESGDITEIQKKYSELNTISELMASDSLGVASVNIGIEKTIVPLNLFLEIIKEQLVEMSSMTVTLTGEEEVEFAGATYTKLSADVVANDIPMYQEYYFRAVDGYMMCMTVTWLDGYETEKETLMSGFDAF